MTPVKKAKSEAGKGVVILQAGEQAEQVSGHAAHPGHQHQVQGLPGPPHLDHPPRRLLCQDGRPPRHLGHGRGYHARPQPGPARQVTGQSHPRIL